MSAKTQRPTTDAAAKKKAFIRQLASFLVGNQVGKSLWLQVERQSAQDDMPGLAKEWAALREKTNLFGYPTIEEAIEELTRFLA